MIYCNMIEPINVAVCWSPMPANVYSGTAHRASSLVVALEVSTGAAVRF